LYFQDNLMRLHFLLEWNETVFEAGKELLQDEPVLVLDHLEDRLRSQAAFASLYHFDEPLNLLLVFLPNFLITLDLEL
jgi:hypothetical protein